MFWIFKKNKKSELEKNIEKDGVEHAAKRFSEIMLQKVLTAKNAYQFILEELEEASQGNEEERKFAKNSGISAQEYTGAMRNSSPEVDLPRQFILDLCRQLHPNVDLAVELRIKIVDNIMRFLSIGKYNSQETLSLKGGMRLQEDGVDILFIVKDNVVIYINKEIDHLFEVDNDGDEKLHGRVVNYVFSGQSTGSVIEVFVAFDDSESYMIFSLQNVLIERLQHVSRSIFKYFAEYHRQGIFSPIDQYATQFIYTFRLYRRDGIFFMVNNSQTQAYLIDKKTILRDNVDEIKRVFWG